MFHRCSIDVPFLERIFFFEESRRSTSVLMEVLDVRTVIQRIFPKMQMPESIKYDRGNQDHDNMLRTASQFLIRQKYVGTPHSYKLYRKAVKEYFQLNEKVGQRRLDSLMNSKSADFRIYPGIASEFGHSLDSSACTAAWTPPCPTPITGLTDGQYLMDSSTSTRTARAAEWDSIEDEEDDQSGLGVEDERHRNGQSESSHLIGPDMVEYLASDRCQFPSILSMDDERISSLHSHREPLTAEDLKKYGIHKFQELPERIQISDGTFRLEGINMDNERVSVDWKSSQQCFMTSTLPYWKYALERTLELEDAFQDLVEQKRRFISTNSGDGDGDGDQEMLKVHMFGTLIFLF
jgi:hypothetical protein